MHNVQFTTKTNLKSLRFEEDFQFNLKGVHQTTHLITSYCF